MKIRIATRQSPLALAQTRAVAAALVRGQPDLEVEEVPLTTKGDQILDQPLAKIGGKGLFITEVEAALVEGRAELAVHSMKDVPDELAPGMGLLCIPERADPRDALVSREGLALSELPQGARVGTSSLRRACQLHHARPDLRFSVLRGNVGTRLGKLDGGEYDAIVLALAGLLRLDLDKERRFVALPHDLCLPAVGQGALGIEGRLDDRELTRLLGPLEHPLSRLAVEAERAYLARLEGSCTTPIAAHARFEEEGSRMRIHGMVASVDGEELLQASTEGWIDAPDHASRLQQAVRMGVEIAEMQLDRGAAAIVASARATEDPYLVGPYGPKPGTN